LLEQIGIVPLSNVWVTPVIALPVSTLPLGCRRHATHFIRWTRETFPEGRLSYSEKFTAAPVNGDQSAQDGALSENRLTVGLAELSTAPFEHEHLRRDCPYT
jgi:hypothetical protein